MAGGGGGLLGLPAMPMDIVAASLDCDEVHVLTELGKNGPRNAVDVLSERLAKALAQRWCRAVAKAPAHP